MFVKGPSPIPFLCRISPSAQMVQWDPVRSSFGEFTRVAQEQRTKTVVATTYCLPKIAYFGQGQAISCMQQGPLARHGRWADCCELLLLRMQMGASVFFEDTLFWVGLKGQEGTTRFWGFPNVFVDTYLHFLPATGIPKITKAGQEVVCNKNNTSCCAC